MGHSPVAQGSCLRRRDPAASGDTSGWESTKGKRSCGLLRSGVGRSIPDAEGGRASPTSLVRDTQMQRGDHPRCVVLRGLLGTGRGGAGIRALPYTSAREIASPLLFPTGSAHLHWARPSAHPVCEGPSWCVRKNWVFLDARSGDLGPPAHLCGVAKTLSTHLCRRTGCRAVSE